MKDLDRRSWRQWRQPRAPHLQRLPGASVLIAGVGATGFYAIQMAKAMGAGRIDYLDHDRGRLELAAKLGANGIKVGRDEPKSSLESQYEIAVDTRGDPDELALLLRSLGPTGVCTSMSMYFRGAILALACDVRIAARGNCKIGLNELAIGIAPPRGAYEIGRLALTNQKMWKAGLGAELHDADGARELGLIDEVVEAGDLERVCVATARRLGSYPRDTYAHSKRMVQHAAVQAVLNETEEQLRALVEVWTSPETTQALLAQLAGISSKPKR